MFFRFQNLNGEDVVGGEASLDNVYISVYGKLLPGEKKPEELEIGECCRKEYSLSGMNPTTYIIVRTA